MKYFNLDQYYKVVDGKGQTYWSGLDVSIYINNYYLTEAIQLEYQVSEAVMPAYHYSSYVPDKIVHGARLISGSFALNTTYFSYMHEVLNVILGRSQPAAPRVVYEETQDYAFPGDIDDVSIQQLRNFAKSASELRKARVNLPDEGVGLVRDDAPMFQFPSDATLTISLGTNRTEKPKIIAPIGDGPAEILEYIQIYNPDAEVPYSVKTFSGFTITNQSQIITDDGKSIIEKFDFMARTITNIK